MTLAGHAEETREADGADGSAASEGPASSTRYPHLAASLAEAPIVAKGDYDYFVNPLSDGIPIVRPALIREAATGLARHLAPYRADTDKMATAEAMGLPLATALALESDLPFVTARKRAYGLDGERELAQVTGYSKNRLWLNGIVPGDRVVVVDDVISTGGTLRALVAGLRDNGAVPLAVLTVFSKDPEPSTLARALGCPVHALVSCHVARTETGKHVVLDAVDVVGRP